MDLVQSARWALSGDEAFCPVATSASNLTLSGMWEELCNTGRAECRSKGKSLSKKLGNVPDVENDKHR